MPRVLLLFEFPTINGGENSQLATLSAVQAAGYHVVALAPKRGQVAVALKARMVDVVPWHVRDADGHRRPQRQLREELRMRFDKLCPDLIHANSLSMARLAGPVATWVGTPGVGHLRDILRLSARAINDLNRNARLLAVSHAVRRWHVAAGLDGGKTTVLYNGVDLAKFRPRDATGYLQRELGVPTSSPLIGSIGQVGMRKGLDIWLAAAKSIALYRRDVHFVIVGVRHSEKEEARGFERQIREVSRRNPLAGRVHFLGRRNDVHHILNELTIFVHAPRQEPLGRVLLEAGASGTAIVATDVGGTKEIFPHDKAAACLVPVDDTHALSSAVARLLDDGRACRELGSAARQRIEASFDAKEAGRHLVAHYQTVLSISGARENSGREYRPG